MLIFTPVKTLAFDVLNERHYPVSPCTNTSREASFASKVSARDIRKGTASPRQPVNPSRNSQQQSVLRVTLIAHRTRMSRDLTNHLDPRSKEKIASSHFKHLAQQYSARRCLPVSSIETTRVSIQFNEHRRRLI